MTLYNVMQSTKEMEADLRREALHRTGSMILIIGGTGAGKTTFIDACTSEGYLLEYQSDSTASHRSKNYKIRDRDCFYHEEPPCLENAENSLDLIHEFARTLILSYNENHVVGIIYVLNHSNGAEDVAFERNVRFAQSWIGDKCSKYTILYQNRVGAGPQAMARTETFRSIWHKCMGKLTSGPSVGLPIDVVDRIASVSLSTAVPSPPTLELQHEIFMKKKQFRETKAGKLYLKQLKKWIADAKREKREEENKNSKWSLNLGRLKTKKPEATPTLVALERKVKGLEDLLYRFEAEKLP